MSGSAFRSRQKTRTESDFGERCDTYSSDEILTAPIENVGAVAAGGERGAAAAGSYGVYRVLGKISLSGN